MRGQWIGDFEGNTSGIAVIELDDLGNQYEGTAAGFPTQAGANVPPIYADLRIPKNDTAREFDIELSLQAIDPSSATPVPWEAIAHQFPGLSFESQLKTHWEFDSENNLHIKWRAQSGEQGQALLYPGRANQLSEFKVEAHISTWSEFKEFAVAQEPDRYVFRGQESNKWRLRTHFHRMGRFNLRRFVGHDIQVLHGNLSSMTQHLFNLNDTLQNAAFYSLVQHHGYPTPLLDWTHSPFISAFFAYRNLRKENRSEDGFVRIFVLDRREWQRDVMPLSVLSPAPPHFSFLSPLSINNPRLVPQQAISSVTNVDDIEALISHASLRNRKTYLRVIDLPASERPVVMQELALMGITAGSLFPGLDGACEQLKERLFEL